MTHRADPLLKIVHVNNCRGGLKVCINKNMPKSMGQD